MKPVRKPLSPSRREKFRILKNGICNECGDNVGNSFDIDHLIPLENGGKDDESNFQLLCKPCHKLKTKADIKIIAKVRSIRQKHEGAKVPKQSIKSAPFPKSIKSQKAKTKTQPPRTHVCGQPIGE